MVKNNKQTRIIVLRLEGSKQTECLYLSGNNAVSTNLDDLLLHQAVLTKF